MEVKEQTAAAGADAEGAGDTSPGIVRGARQAYVDKGKGVKKNLEANKELPLLSQLVGPSAKERQEPTLSTYPQSCMALMGTGIP